MTQNRTPRPRRDRRDAQALELWRAGTSFDLIAGQLNFKDAEAAEAAAVREMERSPQPNPADLQRLELHRLDVLQMAMWPKARRGDKAAVAAVLDIQRQRQRLQSPSSAGDISLLDAVNETVAATTELDASRDAALIASAQKIAAHVDEATKEDGKVEVAVKALYMIPHLNNILQQMLATPAARRAVEDAVKGEAHGSRLVNFQEEARKRRGEATA